MKKRRICCAAFTLALALTLCGCGADKANDEPAITAIPAPDVSESPLITPDAGNGMIGENDGNDGVIVDGSVTPSASVTDDAAASTPKASAAPTAQAQQ